MTGPARRGFASDNAAGTHSAVLTALAEANRGHAHAYGYDEWTARAEQLVRAQFGADAEVFFVFNGTGANVSGLQALMRPFESVICAETAHIAVDECGAPGRFTGGVLETVPTPDGKLTPELIEGAIRGVGFEHHSQPRVVSITQSSEYGTVYAPAELAAIGATARDRGLYLHVDGARLANAAASLGCTLGEACEGADVVSFGLTKNGAMLAESVVFRTAELARDFRYIRKQSAQLASKMRFIAAQYTAMLEGDLWKVCAGHANAMAALLAERLSAVPAVTVTQRVDANEVFAVLPKDTIESLQAEFDFYTWDECTGEVRLVASWDTTADDVEALVEGIRRAVSG